MVMRTYKKNRKPKGFFESKQAKDAAYREDWRRIVNFFKDRPCESCGEEHPTYCMDFHHVDPSEKLFSIGRAPRANLARLIAEIQKCVVLCANCHRKAENGHMEVIEL